MANKYAGTQTEKNLMEAFQENHKQEINILTSLQKQKKKVLNKFHLYS